MSTTDTPRTDAASFESRTRIHLDDDYNDVVSVEFAEGLERELNANAWLPMSTAPKDGTFIHVAARCVHANGNTIKWSMIVEWDDYDGGRWIDDHADYNIRPEWATGWRPIPTLPTAPVTELK